MYLVVVVLGGSCEHNCNLARKRGVGRSLAREEDGKRNVQKDEKIIRREIDRGRF